MGDQLCVGTEASDLKLLQEKGMTVITAKDGLKVDEFRAAVKKVVAERFGAKWGKYYEMIDAIK